MQTLRNTNSPPALLSEKRTHDEQRRVGLWFLDNAVSRGHTGDRELYVQLLIHSFECRFLLILRRDVIDLILLCVISVA